MSRKTGQAALGFILVTVLIDVIGLGIIIPVLPALIRELIGGDLSQASAIGGWLMFSYAVMQFLCAPILGNLSDRFGRRPVLLISLFGFGLDYILLAVAPTIGWLFLGRILAGITGASITTASAYIADISTPDKRAQHFGLMGAMFGLGFIIGPLLGGILGQWGSRVPFMVSAGLAFLNWLYGYFVLPESLPADRRRAFDWKRAHPFGSLKHLRKYPAISSLVLSLTMVYIAIHAVQTTWSYYNMGKFGWDERMIGYSLAFVGFLVAIVQGGLIRFIIPKFGARRSLLAGLSMHAMGLLLFAFATQGWMMFAFSLVYCFGGIAEHHFRSGSAERTGRTARIPDESDESDLDHRSPADDQFICIFYQAECLRSVSGCTLCDGIPAVFDRCHPEFKGSSKDPRHSAVNDVTVF